MRRGDGPSAVEPAVARRWFWGLVVIAVVAMGVLYRALHAHPGATSGLTVAFSGLLLAAASVQASRILLVLSGSPRLRRRRGQPSP